MSKIIVDTIESSGTTVTIADNTTVSGNVDAGTNAVTAGSVTGITAASITSGTLGAGASVTNASLAAGTIIQAVTATLTAAESWAYNGVEAWSAIGTSGCQVSITPSAASSKILIIYSIGGITSYNGNTPVTRILRSISGGTATAPLVATGASNRAEGQTIAPGYVGGTQASGEIAWDTGSHFIDSPNTTSAITYSIQWHGRATSTFTNYVNRAYNDTDGDYVGRGVTVITAMEIKA